MRRPRKPENQGRFCPARPTQDTQTRLIRPNQTHRNNPQILTRNRLALAIRQVNSDTMPGQKSRQIAGQTRSFAHGHASQARQALHHTQPQIAAQSQDRIVV